MNHEQLLSTEHPVSICTSLINRLKSYLPIKFRYFLEPAASGDLPPPLRDMFSPCKVDSLSRRAFQLLVKPKMKAECLNSCYEAATAGGETGEI